MKAIHVLAIILTLILLQAWSIPSTNPSIEKDSIMDVYLFQGGKESIAGSEIEVRKEKFALRFFCKRYNTDKQEFNAVRVAAFRDKKELDKIVTGKSTAEYPCFEPGSGMAPDPSGYYESLVFNDAGNHYLYYENAENNRLTLLEETGENLKLEFEIGAFYYNEKEEKINQTALKEFYLAILIDRNLDEKIDEGELHKITVKFK